MLGVLDSCICAFAKEDRVGSGACSRRPHGWWLPRPSSHHTVFVGGRECSLLVERLPSRGFPSESKGRSLRPGIQGAPCPGFLYLTV